MKSNKLLLALLVLATQHSFAYEYKMTCVDNKLTRFEKLSVDQTTDECKAFIAGGFLECFDSRKNNKSSEMMTLSSPNDQYYQNKESSRYSRKAIQEIIDSAIREGNDPYLTLSIVMTENPPIVSSKKGLTSGDLYVNTYGKIPLDAIAVADSMGCDRVKTGYGDNGLMQVKNAGAARKFVTDAKGTEFNVCMDNHIVAGQGANFFVPIKVQADDCCIKLKASPNDFIITPFANGTDVDTDIKPELRAKILDLLAQKYMNTRFSSATKRAASERLPETKMAMIAQSYNGFGLFGVSEPMMNRCLHKIRMSERPVYGAGTSEIMVNSLMNNSEVSGMVAASLKKNSKDFPMSHLCASYGAGTHTLDGYTFTNLLGQYIGQRPTCPKFSNKLKKLSAFAKTSAPVNQLNGSFESSGSNADTKKSSPAGTAK